MKTHGNLLAAILLFTLLLCLCSCSNGQTKQSVSFNEIESSTLQNENSEETPEIDYSSLIFCENGKYGIYARNDTVLVSVEYDDICYGYLDVEGFYVLTLYDNAETGFYFVEHNGTFISQEPSDGYYAYVLDDDTPINILVFTASGSQYTYAVNTATGKSKFISGVYPQILPETENGYFIFMQFSRGKVKDFGVVDSEGKFIIEPVYQRISIPFPDRFLLYSGEVWDGIEFALCNITDNRGNAINSSFNLVEYKVFDDGSYIGIGTSAGKEASVPCYDENGNVREFGCWFIDKDGNTLSKRFDYFSCNIRDISSDGILSATDADGNTTLIQAADYICKP